MCAFQLNTHTHTHTMLNILNISTMQRKIRERREWWKVGEGRGERERTK